MKNITIKHYNNKVKLYNENAGVLYTHFVNAEAITVQDYIYFRKYIRRKLKKETGIKYNVRFGKLVYGYKYIGIRFELYKGNEFNRLEQLEAENTKLKELIKAYLTELY